MESLIDLFGLEQGLLRGFIFGLVHVGLLIIGYYSGWSINRFLKLSSKGYISGITGAAVAHVIADLVAALIDPTVRAMTFGIVIGGLIPLFLIPILDKFIIKSKNHMMEGDHEDFKNDLKESHS